jgi:hypothetical protein
MMTRRLNVILASIRDDRPVEATMISIKDFVPPIVVPLARKVKGLVAAKDVPAPKLFDGEGLLFEEAVAGASVYFEYGMGLSTLWALKHTTATIYAVDTSSEWVSTVEMQAGNMGRGRLNAKWVDLGPVENWGYPSSYAHRNRFEDYMDFVWTSGLSPDVVLIDGRFRVCSFLHSLLKSRSGTKIIFDDYRRRAGYHVVEEFLPISHEFGRQCLFVVPPEIDRQAIAYARDKFLYVMD